jgi:excisionase family DNA binding protein
MAPRTDTETPDRAAPAASVLAGETRIQIPLKEAARLLAISEWLAYKLIRAGALPANRLGNNLYIPTVALRRYEQTIAQPQPDTTQGGEVA